MAQLGHSDPKMTLGVYAKVIATNADHGAELDRLIGHSTGASFGTSAISAAESAPDATPPNPEKRLDDAEAADGIRTHDLLHGKQTL
jgi:hypothetical protein